MLVLALQFVGMGVCDILAGLVALFARWGLCGRPCLRISGGGMLLGPLLLCVAYPPGFVGGQSCLCYMVDSRSNMVLFCVLLMGLRWVLLGFLLPLSL